MRKNIVIIDQHALKLFYALELGLKINDIVS